LLASLPGHRWPANHLARRPRAGGPVRLDRTRSDD
jgi:hypothetical protein